MSTEAAAQARAEALSARAYHHLFMALRDTYKDPGMAFKRLETLYAQGKADRIRNHPALLGAMNRSGLRTRIHRKAVHRRVADIVRRYGMYAAEATTTPPIPIPPPVLPSPPTIKPKERHGTFPSKDGAGVAVGHVASQLFRTGQIFFER